MSTLNLAKIFAPHPNRTLARLGPLCMGLASTLTLCIKTSIYYDVDKRA